MGYKIGCGIIKTAVDYRPVCEHCKITDTGGGAWIWSVPHWFCSHKCKTLYYNKHFDIIQDESIITLKYQQCPKCKKQMEYLEHKRIFKCYDCATERLQNGDILE